MKTTFRRWAVLLLALVLLINLFPAAVLASGEEAHQHVWRFPAAGDAANVQWDTPSEGSLTVYVTCDEPSCRYHTTPYPLVADVTETVTTPATCTQPGVQKLTATATLGDATAESWRFEDVPALGHSWGSDRTCTRCSAKKPAESADVKVTVPADPDAPAVALPAESRLALESAVLTAKDRALLADGIPITIRLEVTDADDTVPEADALAVADELAGMPDYALGQYLDVSLF